MNRISLVSEKMTLKGDFGRSDINFLVWDEGRHKFETHPSADKHCIAAFCRQGNQMAVIRMHGSFSTSVKDAHFSWLKNGDGVHVGLEQYRLNFSVEKNGRSLFSF